MEDNYSLWERREVQLEKELALRPVCGYCDEHIQGEYCYEVNGELICEECMEDHFRKATEDCIT